MTIPSITFDNTNVGLVVLYIINTYLHAIKKLLMINIKEIKVIGQ